MNGNRFSNRHAARCRARLTRWAALAVAALAAAAVSAAAAPAPAAPAEPPAAAPAPAAPASSAPAPADVFDYGRFGAVSIYRGSGESRELVLFASGDGGWNLGVVGMAELLAQPGTIVAGFDIRHYLHALEDAADKCVSPDADFENLSHYVQSRLALKTYIQPTLVGYSSGATLAYATLVESPDGLFKGALSLGFCPDLDLKKPLCKGSGLESSPKLDSKGRLEGAILAPAKQLYSPWIALQGEADQVCAPAATQQFVTAVRGAEIVMLPKVGHGYSVEKNWVPQFQAAYARITAPEKATRVELPARVADLPLTVIPAASGGSSPWFGVFLSGDGGWVGLDKGVSEALARQYIPIVGWDSLKYFWSPRTPANAAQDLDRVLRHYAELWGKSHAVLIGYSQGADTMPFMVNRLPSATRALVGLTTLLGLGERANFEFHFAEWLGGGERGGLAIAPELNGWTGSPYLCLYGEEDKDAACAQLTGKDGSAVKMPGGHHFGGSYEAIAQEILSHLPKDPAERAPSQ